MSLPIDAHIPVLTEIIPPDAPDAPRPAPEDTDAAAADAAAADAAAAGAAAPGEVAEPSAQEPATPSPSAPLTPEEPAAPPAPTTDSFAAPSAAAAAEPIDLPAQAKPALSRQQWDELETQVSERVLLQLQNRIDVVLEQRVRDCLADALQLAVSHLADDIRQGLENSLKDVISGAVTQEIAKLKTERQF